MNNKINPMTFEWPDEMPDGWVQLSSELRGETLAGSSIKRKAGSVYWWLHCIAYGKISTFIARFSENHGSWRARLYQAERNYYLAKQASAREAAEKQRAAEIQKLRLPLHLERWQKDFAVSDRKAYANSRLDALLPYLAAMDIELQTLKNRVADLEK